MRDVLPALLAWWRDGRPIGLGTVVGTYSSAPRLPGAAMAVGADGTVVGSVSGGCIEGAVYQRAQSVVAGETPAGVQRYGVSDDDAFAVGLTCGGIIDIFVEKLDSTTFPEFDRLVAAVHDHRPVALATVVDGPGGTVGRHLLVFADEVVGDLGTSRRTAAVGDDARGLLASGRSGRLQYGPDGERLGDGLSVFVNVFAPPSRLLIFGAIDFAAALSRQGALLGYDVTVCDARPIFATPQRFPEADRVVVDWPHRYLQAEIDAGRVGPSTVVCVLTHDPKFDIPLLTTVLTLPDGVRPGYIGAMGSRRTHADRAEQLLANGVHSDQLAQLRSPIGLDLGARTPEETAVSIVAEIIADRWRGRGGPLSEGDGAIHRRPGGDQPLSAGITSRSKSSTPERSQAASGK